MKFIVNVKIDEEWEKVAEFRPPYRMRRFLWWQWCFDCSSAEAIAAAAAGAYAEMQCHDEVVVIRQDGPDVLTVYDVHDHFSPTWEA